MIVSEEFYYDVYHIKDRLEEEIISQYKTLSKASIVYGKSRPYFHQTLHNGGLSLDLIIYFSKFINVSVEYILTGKNKREYENITHEMAINSIIKLLKNKKYRKGIILQMNDRALTSQLVNNKKKTITMCRLLSLEQKFSMSIYKIITL